MSFDWISFLNSNGIAYVDTGRNVRRNNVSLACPFCGDDPSENLGISLVGKGYSCWRNKNHRGIHPHRLIMQLLGCTFQQAAAIVASESVGFVTTDESFADDCLSRLGVKTECRYSTGKLEFLEEFQPLHKSSLAKRWAYPYLRQRGYRCDYDIEWLSKHFELKFAYSGRYGYRIIFPVRHDGVLLNWTGRTVADSEKLRYKSLSSDPESAAKEGLPTAPVNIKECILDYDNLYEDGGEELVVVEGPFDAARITFFGEEYGIFGAALFSKYSMPTQLDLLASLIPKFKRRTVLLDNDAFADSWFSLPDYLQFKTRVLPEGDPAELTFKKFKALFNIS